MVGEGLGITAFDGGQAGTWQKMPDLPTMVPSGQIIPSLVHTGIRLIFNIYAPHNKIKKKIINPMSMNFILESTRIITDLFL